MKGTRSTPAIRRNHCDPGPKRPRGRKDRVWPFRRDPRKTSRCWLGGACPFLLLLAAPAHADVTDVEVPVVVLEPETPGTPHDEALDLANIVQSAAKGVT